MSLIPTANAGAPEGDLYFIENIGGPGAGVGDAPCIKGTTLGAVRIGNPSAGVIIRGDTSVSSSNRMGGAQAAGGSFTIGNSAASVDNIVLSDNLITVNDQMTFAVGTALTVNNAIGATAGASPSTATLDTYTNRNIHGYSDKGYYVASVVVAGGGAFANPPNLPYGLFSVMLVTGAGLGQEQAEASAICFYDATGWYGNGVSYAFSGGTPNAAISPINGRATLQLGGAGIPPGNVVFRQLLAV